MRFIEDVAIVTGGSTGIGRATCELLANEGCKVYNLDINPEVKSSGSISYIKCDVRNHNQIKAGVKYVVDKEGKINYLFANAGIHKSGTVESASVETLRDILETNLVGMWLTLKEVIPHMVKEKEGSIVLMGSDQCFIGKGDSSIYGLTKGAIGQLTKSTAIDYASHGIRVNCICPGTIDTPLADTAITNFSKSSGESEVKIREFLAKAQPIKRLGTPAEVAFAVSNLLDKRSGFTTGGLYPIDGGYTSQ